MSHEFLFAALETQEARRKDHLNLEVGGAQRKLIFYGGLPMQFVSSEIPIHCKA